MIRSSDELPPSSGVIRGLAVFLIVMVALGIVLWVTGDDVRLRLKLGVAAGVLLVPAAIYMLVTGKDPMPHLGRTPRHQEDQDRRGSAA